MEPVRAQRRIVQQLGTGSQKLLGVGEAVEPVAGALVHIIRKANEVGARVSHT